jgi:hypothetical protein
MTLAELKKTLAAAAPPASFPVPLAALWWSARGDWETAHALVMNDESREAARVHAYLHRQEGDLANAGYWYRRAGVPAADGPLTAEWEKLAADLLGSM